MITCYYTCKACGTVKRPVQVPARTTEDVVSWLRKVVAFAIGNDHRTHSPKCQATKMSDLMIPLPPESEFIGQQIE